MKRVQMMVSPRLWGAVVAAALVAAVMVTMYPSSSAGAVDPVPEGSVYVPVAPFRTFDTRSPNSFGYTPNAGVKVASGSKIDVPITGAHAKGPEIPVDAVAVMINLTYTGAGTSANGWITAFPAGGATPVVSNINKSGVDTVANLVAVRIGQDGKISVANQGTPAHLLGDIAGYYVPGTPGEKGDSCTVSREADIVTISCEDGTSESFPVPPEEGPNPDPAGFLVIAWTNLDGVDGYDPDNGDVFIAGVYDVNDDACVSAGDEVRTGRYPKNPAGTEFGDFGVTSHAITSSFNPSGGIFQIDGDGTYFQFADNALESEAPEYFEERASAEAFSTISGSSSGNHAYQTDTGSPSEPADTVDFTSELDLVTVEISGWTCTPDP